MKRNIQAIIYDWDDVILRVAHGYFQLLQETANKLGSRPLTFEDFSNVYGLPEDVIARTLFSGVPVIEVIRTYRNLNPMPYGLIQGAKETLSFTLSNYPVNGILTTRRRERLSKRANENDIDLQLFTFVITGEDILYPKPDPRAFDPVKKELAVYGITPEKALYVGDSLLDFQSANGAGLHFVGVLTGITEKDKFVNCGVSSMIIPSIAELPEFLESGLNGNWTIR